MYRFYLKQGQEQILLPVSPAEFVTKVGNSNKIIEILNIGEVNLLKKIGLRHFSFTILLPAKQWGSFQMGEPFQEPIFFLNKFREYKEKQKPVQLIIFRKLADGSQLFDGNVAVSLEDYTVKEKAGGEGDFWVELNWKEYRKISSTQYKAQAKDGKTTLTATGMQRDSKEAETTYVVKEGDSLWKIAKTQLNDGSKYQAIAQKNGISNPNQIYVGQVLQLGV